MKFNWMERCMNKFSFKSFSLETQESLEADLTLENYDLSLFVASWEERSVSIRETKKFASNKAFIFKFEPPNGDNCRSTNAEKLRIFLNESNIISDIVKLSKSVENAKNFHQMKTLITDCYRSTGQPISLFIDITCMPKYYFCALLGFCFRLGITKSITFHYAHADYSARIKKHSSTSKKWQFTEGDWVSKVIPYCEGIFHPSLQRACLLSMGAEANRVERFLNKYQPEKVFVYCPIPGINKELTKFAEQESAALSASMDETSYEISNIPAYSVIEIVEKSIRLISDKRSLYDFTIMPLGTKPHALALALVSLFEESASLIARVPKVYSERPVAASGKATIVKIWDRSIAL